MSYLSVVYKNRPETDYPFQLAKYLCKRYGILPHKYLLDVGCGLGKFMDAFDQRCGLICHGLDWESGRSDTQKCDVFRARWPYPSNHFDVVFMKSIIEHGLSPDWMLSETMRVLKPGGRIIILAPDWVSQMETFWEDPSHMKPYTVQSIRDLLLINKFENVESELFYQLPIVWKYPILKRIGFMFNILSVPQARRMGKIRWMRELMILGTGTKKI